MGFVFVSYRKLKASGYSVAVLGFAVAPWQCGAMLVLRFPASWSTSAAA